MPEGGWTHENVASATLVQLCSSMTKPVFNVICFVSGILEHVTNRLIEIIDIPSKDKLNREEFDRVFKAFSEQTKV